MNRPAGGLATNRREEILRITVSMTVTCVLGAVVLGGLYVLTDRYQRAAVLRAESSAIVEMLGLDSTSTVIEVRQYLDQERREVVYRAQPLGGAEEPVKQLVFSLDGQLVSRENSPAGAEDSKRWLSLGRLFLARHAGRNAGFVVEGGARGYKNRIRFLVALSRDFEIAGVRVVEHEEDPGLGAEVATPVFQGQFVARAADQLPSLLVTRDPMPEDWRAALTQLERVPVASWRRRHASLLERESTKPIYAVTGATISSRALADGVRTTVDHFRRRWALLDPYLGAET